MKKAAKFLSMAMILFALISGCKKEKGEPVITTKKDNIQLSFKFNHNIDGIDLVTDTIMYENKAGNKYSVINLKYFISNITLHKINGDSVLIDDEHYVDIADNNTLIYTPSQNIVNDFYNSISFIFGLDTIKNVTGRYPNPPESNMLWPTPMGGGYHYMKLEGKIDSSGVILNYNTHMGELMGIPYFIHITLPASSFTADGNNLRVNLSMNINEWYENPNTYDFYTFGSAIMGNSVAQQQLHENGADVFTVSSIE